jgi:hypothetical protein
VHPQTTLAARFLTICLAGSTVAPSASTKLQSALAVPVVVEASAVASAVRLLDSTLRTTGADNIKGGYGGRGGGGYGQGGGYQGQQQGGGYGGGQGGYSGGQGGYPQQQSGGKETLHLIALSDMS